jgi:hypothetical protein
MSSNSTADAANRLRAAGLVVLPLPPRRKAPPQIGWDRYSTDVWPTNEEHAGWFASGEPNLAVVCGVQSLKLIVLVSNDRDLSEVLGPAPWDTWLAESVRGQHLYLRIRGDLPATGYWRHHGETVLELRASRAYVVAPPSIHPSGAVYTWAAQPEEIAVVERDEFEAWLRAGLQRAHDAGWEMLGHETRQHQPATEPLYDADLVGAPVKDDTAAGRRRAQGILRASATTVANTPSGGRHNTLREKAFGAGGMVASGWLGLDEVYDAFRAASETNGHIADDGETVVYRCIRDAVRAGFAEPWEPEDLGDSQEWRERQASDVGEVHIGGARTEEASEEAIGAAALLGPVPVAPVAVLPLLLREMIRTSSLPPTLLLGAFGGALDTAIGHLARVRVGFTRAERVITWTPLIGPAGAGKSPAIEYAYAPLQAVDELRLRAWIREHATWLERFAVNLDAGMSEADFRASDPEPILRQKLLTDTTLEELAVALGEHPARGFRADELSQVVRGLNEYKAAGADEGRMLSLWTGAAWDYRRKTKRQHIYVAEPTVTVCGAITDTEQHLLGRVGSGMLARWLPHLVVEMSAEVERYIPQGHIEHYGRLIRLLLGRDDTPRIWTLDDGALKAFEQIQVRWKTQAMADDCTTSVRSALAKAVPHLLRLALRLAETDLALKDLPAITVDDDALDTLPWTPPSVLQIDAWTLRRAATWVDFCLDTWRAMEGELPLSLSFAAAAIDKALVAVRAYLDRKPGQWVPTMLLRRNNVGGIASSGDLKEVIKRWRDRYPEGEAWRFVKHSEHGHRVLEFRAPRRAQSAGSATQSAGPEAARAGENAQSAGPEA